MQLIGISGFKTSGKDTTYQIIRDELATVKRVARVAFADKLKIMAARALGFTYPDDDLIATMDDFKETGHIRHEHVFLSENMGPMVMTEQLTGREYLQYFGANAREVFGDTFWIDQILPEASDHPVRDNREVENIRALNRAYPDVDVLCVTDVRYPNEAHRIRALGGTVLEVVRPGLESDGHSSEIPLPREFVNTTIVNDGTLDDLRNKIAMEVSRYV